MWGETLIHYLHLTGLDRHLHAHEIGIDGSDHVVHGIWLTGDSS
jgi:hypothetical protein